MQNSSICHCSPLLSPESQYTPDARLTRLHHHQGFWGGEYMYRTIGLHIVIALGITACATPDEDIGNIGHVDLTLTGTSASGITYRLRDAELTINGAIAPIVFHTEDDPTRTLITQQLDVGNYSLRLTPGWRLERLGTGGVVQTVVAN